MSGNQSAPLYQDCYVQMIVSTGNLYIVVAWLFLHETLKKPDHRNTTKLSPSIAATNDGDVINDSMETVSDSDLNSNLEKGREHQPLLGSHGHKKTLVLVLSITHMH